LEGSKVVLAAKDDLESFINASLNPEVIEEVLRKIRPDPVFENSREALARTLMAEEIENIGLGER